MNFFQKIGNSLARFMYGRNGVDQLGFVTLWAAIILDVVNLFVRNQVAYSILSAVAMVLLGSMVRPSPGAWFHRYNGRVRPVIPGCPDGQAVRVAIGNRIGVGCAIIIQSEEMTLIGAYGDVTPPAVGNVPDVNVSPACLSAVGMVGYM